MFTSVCATWYAESEGSCNPAQDAGAGNTQCHIRRKCWFTRRVSKIKPLFPHFPRDYKNSDRGLRRRPERYETTQTHIAPKFGIILTFPFEFWVSMRSNSPFARNHFMKLAWRSKQNLAPIPPSFSVRASQESGDICYLSGRQTRPSLKVACLTPFPV